MRPSASCPRRTRPLFVGLQRGSATSVGVWLDVVAVWACEPPLAYAVLFRTGATDAGVSLFTPHLDHHHHCMPVALCTIEPRFWRDYVIIQFTRPPSLVPDLLRCRLAVLLRETVAHDP